MAEQKYSIDRDLREAAAMVKALTPYIYENELYGNIGGFFGGDMPKLTLGGLLMRLRRLLALRGQMNDTQRAQLEQLIARNDEVRREWSVHYEGKMLREANSRLDAMKAFFDECRDNRRLCGNAYLPEAMRRTLVEELRLAMEQQHITSAELDNKVRGTDRKLRGYVEPTPFLWDQVLKDIYPQDTFWWLYHRPATE